MLAARMVAGFFAGTGAKSGEFPMSRMGAGRLRVLTKFQPKRLELRLEKTDFRQKSPRLAVQNAGRFCRASAGVMSISVQNNRFPSEISIPSSLAALVCLNGLIFSATPSRLKSEPVLLNQNVTFALAHCSRILSTQS